MDVSSLVDLDIVDSHVVETHVHTFSSFFFFDLNRSRAQKKTRNGEGDAR